MPVIPRSQRTVGTRGAMLPSVSGASGAAIGRAVSGLGNALSRAGASWDAEQQKADQFKFRAELQRFLGDQEQKYQGYTQSYEGDGGNFQGEVLKGFDKDWQRFWGEVPHSQRPQADVYKERFRREFQNRSFREQTRLRGRWYLRQGTDLFMSTILPRVTGNMGSVQQGLTATENIIGSMSGVPREVADKLRKHAATQIFRRWLSQAGPDAAPQVRELITRYQASRSGPTPGSARAAQEEGMTPKAPVQTDLTGVLTSGTSKRRAYGWTRTDTRWQGLDPFEKAAAMSLMEANGMRLDDARNALAAMINRASKAGEDLGAHVSGKIYQPTWERSQQARLGRILQSSQYRQLVQWAKARARGEEADPVQGATHFLAPERTMLALEARNPSKYRSWRKWTGYDAGSGAYRGVIMRDGSHAFLAPDGVAETTPVRAVRPQSTADMFEKLVIENAAKIERHELLEQRNAERAALLKERKIQDATRRQGYELLFDKKLTKGWIEQNKENLSTNAYVTFMKAVVPMGRTTDPETFSNLLERADERPKDIMQEAAEAYARGDLNYDSYRVIASKARKALDPEAHGSAPPWVREQRSIIKQQLRPPRGSSRAQYEAYGKALETFDDYVERQGKDVDRKALREWSQGLVEQTKKGLVNRSRSALSMPRFSQVGRTAMTVEELDEAVKRTIRAYRAKQLSRDEFLAEAKLLQKWRKVIEEQGEADGKPVPAPKPVSGVGGFAAPGIAP